MSRSTPGPQSSSGGSLQKYERIAPFYDLVDLPFEHLRYRAIRPLLFHGLTGRVLDAGVGTGRNFPFYPSGAEVFGVDLSTSMLERAERRRQQSRAVLYLAKMSLTELTFADSFFDAAVASFVFCTMPSEARGRSLRELKRAVKPGGQIRLLEYAPAQSAFRRQIAQAWKPWVQWAFGATLDQDIELELTKAGLELTRSRYVTPSIKLIEATPSTKRVAPAADSSL